MWRLLGYLTTAEACRRLAACACGYSPNAKRLDYQSVQGGRTEAARRAAHLDRQHDTTPAVRERNPWTSVHELVRELFSLA